MAMRRTERFGKYELEDFPPIPSRATQHRPRHSVHCEHFGSPIPERSLGASGEGVGANEFDVEIASTGERIHVAAEQSIVAALAEAGVQVETSCVAGLCGTCEVRYLAGKPDHRDFILNDDEKDSYLTAVVRMPFVPPSAPPTPEDRLLHTRDAELRLCTSGIYFSRPL